MTQLQLDGYAQPATQKLTAVTELHVRLIPLKQPKELKLTNLEWPKTNYKQLVSVLSHPGFNFIRMTR
jgi:hypothetical protein